MISLTACMLNKSTIDANKHVVMFALEAGVDYDAMQGGDKKVLKAKWSATGKPTEIRFYRTAGKRADKRVSIQDITKNTAVGSKIVFRRTKSGNIMVDVT